MKAINHIRLSFPSRSANEGFARVAVASFAAQLDPTVEEVSEIKTAVSEAVTNCIVHGYGDTLGNIVINGRLYEGGKLVLTIRDKGKGIENVQQAMEPLFTTGNAEERSGMGFTIMETFMDKVRVTSKPGIGTTVTFTKYIQTKE
ncbi:MAG: anti-sigma F factor [Clostridia bacterium]|nr:anti-sigma F factor [Clostridia bacterium]